MVIRFGLSNTQLITLLWWIQVGFLALMLGSKLSVDPLANTIDAFGRLASILPLLEDTGSVLWEYGL